MDAPSLHLPVPVTGLFGRARDIAALAACLRRPEVRLVTITGLPGIGKTRLSLEVARTLRNDFADGTYFVPLNAISDPDLVAPAIAQALDVHELGTGSLFNNLKASLRDKQIHLLLDNFEQILSAAMIVAELLAESNHLKILVTSRTALHLSGEYEYMVSPLALPELNQLPPLAELAQLPSVAMFVARAQAVKPDFVLTHANATAVAQVCNRLDGIPLAIELAAARAKVLPPQALLTRLTHPLSVLTNGARDLPPRHQTLHRALEWSYGLLSESEQRLFRRMAVFNGGASIEAAEALYAVGDGLPAHVLDDLGTLLDHSLIQSGETPTGEARFTMLEMIREFAREQLVASGELTMLQQHHADYYLSLAETGEKEFQSPQQVFWIERLELEHDNLRTALHWSSENDTEVALRLVVALWYFWILRSYYSEGRGWLERTLNLVGVSAATTGAEEQWEQFSRERAMRIGTALHGIGTIAYYQSDYDAARLWMGKSLALRRRLGDRRGIAATLNNLGNLAHDESDILGAEALYRESRDLRLEIGDQAGVAGSLSNLGNIALYRGDYDDAAELYTQSLNYRRQVGDKLSISVSLNNLGIVALHQGNYGRAALLYEESLAIKEELGDRNGAAALRNNLGELALHHGDYARADAQFAFSLEIRRQSGDRWGLASVLTNMGTSALHQGDLGRAVALFEESLSLKRAIGDRWSIANSLEGLGRAALHLHDLTQASRLLKESLTLRIEVADKAGAAISLAELAGVAAAWGNVDWAAALLAAAEVLMEATGTSHALAPPDAAEYERTRSIVQNALSADVMAKAERNGRSLTLEQILADIDQALTPAELPIAETVTAAAVEQDDLTVRETEVLKLIANGLSYGQIAEQLVISSRTVDAHLRSIYSKLQVRSRHEATRYALEHHLIDFRR